MKHKIAAVVGLTCTVTCFAYLYEGQMNPDADPTSIQNSVQLRSRYVPNSVVKSEAEVRVAEPLIDSYIAMSGNASLLKKAVRTAWADAQKGDNSFFLVILAMQNQQLIEQNERIIGMLEKKK